MTDTRIPRDNRPDDNDQATGNGDACNAPGTDTSSRGVAAGDPIGASVPTVRHHTPPAVSLPPGVSYHPATETRGAYLQFRDGSKRFVDTDDGYRGLRDVTASVCGLDRVRLTIVKPAPKKLPRKERERIEQERIDAICTGRSATFGHGFIGDHEARRRYGVAVGATVPRSTSGRGAE